jgi:hypothetical protein
MVRGRKRPIGALDETIAFSSVSDPSSSTDSSRPPRFRRSAFLEPEDEGVSARHTSGVGPAMPTTGDDRGGGFAPAHRRTLGPAHGSNRALSKVIAAAYLQNASEAVTADGRPTLPAPEGGRWGGSAPARSDDFSSALGNNQMDSNPSRSDNEPSFSPASWEGNAEAGAKDDGVPPAGASTRLAREAREAVGQVASWPQAARSVAGQGHRPIRFESLTAFDPYGEGQALPKSPRKQLNKKILTEFDTAPFRERLMTFPTKGASRRGTRCS